MQGQKLPIMEDMPILFPDLQPYMSAFQTLSVSRPTGFGLGFIPYSEIVCYMNENDIMYIEERKEFMKWVQFIDHLYVKKMNEKKD